MTRNSRAFQQIQMQLLDSVPKELVQFWTGIGEIADMITNTEALSSIVDISSVREDARTLPDDFQPLSKGCHTFGFINVSADLKEASDPSASTSTSIGSYVTPEEAVEALGLQSKSTTSSSTAAAGPKAEIQTRIKLARLMAFISKHLDRGDLVKTEDGGIQAAITTTVADAYAVDDAEDNTMETMEPEEYTLAEPVSQLEPEPQVHVHVHVQSSQDNQKDVLVYKQAEEGQPALLVPNALLLGDAHGADGNGNGDGDGDGEGAVGEEKTGKEDDGSSLLKLSAMILPVPQKVTTLVPAPAPAPVPQQNPVSVSAPTLRPPPGFQLPVTIPVLPQAAPTLPVHLADTHTGPPGFRPYPSYGNPTPQAVPMPMPPQMPHQPLPTYGMDQNLSFNLPQTRNPFASSRLTRSYGVNSSNSHGVVAHQTHMNAQTSFTSTSTSGIQIGPLPSDQNLGGDGSSMDQHDPFGLRSLGIFGDDRSQPRETNTANHATRNPFY